MDIGLLYAHYIIRERSPRRAGSRMLELRCGFKPACLPVAAVLVAVTAVAVGRW